MAESYKMEADKLKELMGDYEKEQMKNDLAIRAAVDLVRDSAKEGLRATLRRCVGLSCGRT